MYFEIYQDRGGEWRWRLRASNHTIVGDSGEGYKTRAGCSRAVGRIKKTMKREDVAVEFFDA